MSHWRNHTVFIISWIRPTLRGKCHFIHQKTEAKTSKSSDCTTSSWQSWDLNHSPEQHPQSSKVMEAADVGGKINLEGITKTGLGKQMEAIGEEGSLLEFRGHVDNWERWWEIRGQIQSILNRTKERIFSLILGGFPSYVSLLSLFLNLGVF